MCSRVPPEILDEIFSEVECCFMARLNFGEQYQMPDWHRSGEHWHQTRDGAHAAFQAFPLSRVVFIPLLTVSKLWHQLSERRLYQSISVKTHGRVNALEELLRTLTSNTRLAGLVRQLRLCYGTWSFDLQAQVISKCIGLTRLALITSNGWDFGVLTEAISNVRDLKSLVIVRGERIFDVVPRGVIPTQICSAEDLPDWLMLWPDMEYIAIVDTVDHVNTGISTSHWKLGIQRSTQCSQLRQFCSNQVFSASHLRSLATITPSMTSFDIFVDTSTLENVVALSDSLRAWAPVLKDISIRIPLTVTQCIHSLDDGLCQQLKDVKGLRVSACLIPPTSLVHFASVVQLYYTSVPPSSLKLFVTVLPVLKAVKTLDIHVPGLSRSSEGLQLLQEACKVQDVALLMRL